MAISYDQVVAQYDPVLGLEVHVELGTLSKMFCGCATTFGAEPNTQVCPVCLGLPGSLPVVNGKAIEYTIAIGLALNCSIAPFSRFARKNYFYPDMPKNFQTSQYDEPICINGYLDLEVETDDGIKEFRVEIERVHMEEDTGKSVVQLAVSMALITHFSTTTAPESHSLRSSPRRLKEPVNTPHLLQRRMSRNSVTFCVALV
jgi:aspartyl-tRNA(Asn)/glutamyl-tRNA(Gln) amidotransferase subunit B